MTRDWVIAATPEKVRRGDRGHERFSLVAAYSIILPTGCGSTFGITQGASGKWVAAAGQLGRHPLLA